MLFIVRLILRLRSRYKLKHLFLFNISFDCFAYSILLSDDLTPANMRGKANMMELPAAMRATDASLSADVGKLLA